MNWATGILLLQWSWLSWYIFISIRTGHLVERNAVSAVPICAKVFVLRSLCLSQPSSNTPPAFIHESYISQHSRHRFRFPCAWDILWSSTLQFDASNTYIQRNPAWRQTYYVYLGYSDRASESYSRDVGHICRSNQVSYGYTLKRTANCWLATIHIAHLLNTHNSKVWDSWLTAEIPDLQDWQKGQRLLTKTGCFEHTAAGYSIDISAKPARHLDYVETYRHSRISIKQSKRILALYQTFSYGGWRSRHMT